MIPSVLENFLEQYCISRKEELNAETYPVLAPLTSSANPHDGMTSVPVSQDLAVRIET